MTRRILTGATVLMAAALLAFPQAAIAQSDYDDCGVLFEGVECVLFAAQSGGVYTLENLGGFGVDDLVFVAGTLDPGCVTICTEAEGCIFDNSIVAFACGPPVVFIRGDVNGDAVVNGLVDGLYLLGWGFLNGPPLPCDDAADIDDSGDVNPLVDTIYLLTYSFMGPGPPPPAPFPDCDIDPTTDAIFCDIIPPC